MPTLSRTTSLRAPLALLLLPLLTGLLLAVGSGTAQAATGYKYWNYFHVQGATFVFAKTGPAGFKPKNGSVEAYRYGLSNIGAATVTPNGLGLNLIDPVTKKQVNWEGQLTSVTVIASDAMTATAFALAAYTLGPKYSIKFVRGQHSIRGVVVDGSGNLIASKDLGIDATPYEQERQTNADGGPDDLRQKEREEKTQ